MRNRKITNLIMSWIACVALMLPLLTAHADENKAAQNSSVYIQQVDKPVSEIYDDLYKNLEDANFYVVFEPNIGKNLARFAEKWGDNYNRNDISVIRSMVFCNGWYANKVSPLHLTLIEREGKATVLFNRPSSMAQNSPANALFKTIENEVIEAIKKAL